LERFKGATLDRSRIPKVKPLVRSLLVDDAGRLWVWRTTGDGTTAFDVYDTAGKAVASATGPAGLSPYPTPVIEGNTLYGVVTGEDDLPAVVRWRVRAPR
jgi:sugar lactone lactonase YvrE